MRRREFSPGRFYGFGILLLVASLTSIHFDGSDNRLSGVRSLVGSFVFPLQELLQSWGGNLRTSFVVVSDSGELLEENQALRHELAEHANEAARYERLDSENARLRNLLGLSEERKDLRLKLSRIVRRSTSRYFRVMALELEADSGFEVGMPVLAAGGVVGQIRAIDEGGPEVLLMTDPRSAVDVILETSETRGVAVGSGDEESYIVHLQYPDKTEVARVGERVTTTGRDGRFPKGLVVGTVKSVRGAAGREIAIEPTARLESIEYVHVVLGTTGLTEDGSRYLEAKK